MKRNWQIGGTNKSLQIARREFLGFAGGASLFLPISAWGAEAGPAATEIKVDNLSLSEKIMHATVRIVSPTDANHAVVGTGFLFGFAAGPNQQRVVVVTNKHVISGPDSGYFWLTGMKSDGTADFSKHLTLTSNWKTDAILHPNPAIDLAIIPIGGGINALARAGTPAFFTNLDKTLIPTDDEMKDFVPLEPLVTVGYPEGIIDEVNNLPVFHQGVAATPPYLNFDGRPDFLIDIATWPGSSGSPVFVYETGSIVNPRSRQLSFGERLRLLGIIYKDFEQNSSGKMEIHDIPSSADSSGRNPMNIGICVKSGFILDFEPMVAKLP